MNRLFAYSVGTTAAAVLALAVLLAPAFAAVVEARGQPLEGFMCANAYSIAEAERRVGFQLSERAWELAVSPGWFTVGACVLSVVALVLWFALVARSLADLSSRSKLGRKARKYITAGVCVVCAAVLSAHLWAQERPMDGFGWSLVALGDLDADGVSEIAIASPAEPTGRRVQPDGVVRVYSGRTGRKLFRLTGSGLYFGHGLAAVGDCDADGIADFAVRGESVFVYSGRTRKVIRSIPYGSPGDAIAAAGDVDGDGICDLLLQGRPDGFVRGKRTRFGVRLYSVQRGDVIHEWNEPDSLFGFGSALAGSEDVDGDGVPDCVVGIPNERFESDPEPGRVHVYSGQSGELLLELQGQVPNDTFGAAVCSIDFDRDGIAEIAVGAPADVDLGLGRVSIYSATSSEPLSVVEGFERGDEFGYFVAPAGDVDGDAYTDLLVGVPSTNAFDGEYVVISGRDHRIVHRAVGAPFSDTGTSGCGVGDLDGDGHDDFLVAAVGDHFWPTLGLGTATLNSGRDFSVLRRFASTD